LGDVRVIGLGDPSGSHVEEAAVRLLEDLEREEARSPVAAAQPDVHPLELLDVLGEARLEQGGGAVFKLDHAQGEILDLKVAPVPLAEDAHSGPDADLPVGLSE